MAVRAAAVAAGLAGLALTVPTFAASTKKTDGAKCCAVTVEVPTETVTAGGSAARVDASVTRSGNGCTQVSRVVLVRLAGLTPDQVRIERIVSGARVALSTTSGEDGTVQAVDPLADSKLICGATTLAASYRVDFAEEAPAGSVEFVVAATRVNGKVLGSDSATSVVVEAVAQPGAEEAEPEPVRPVQPPAAEETTPPPPPTDEPTEAPSEEPTEEPTEEPSEAAALPPAEETAPPVQVAEPAPEEPALSRRAQTTEMAWLAGSSGLAVLGVLALGVLWQLRRRRVGAPAPAEAAVVEPPSVRPGIGTELAELTTQSIEVTPDR
jgi:hypothetical protein